MSAPTARITSPAVVPLTQDDSAPVAETTAKPKTETTGPVLRHFVQETVAAIGAGTAAPSGAVELPVTRVVTWIAGGARAPLETVAPATVQESAAPGLLKPQPAPGAVPTPELATSDFGAHAVVQDPASRVLMIDLGTLAVPAAAASASANAWTAPRNIVDYAVTLADGRALPDWLSRQKSSILSGVVPENAGRLDLSVTVIYSDGAHETFKVTIDPRTQSIAPLQDKHAGATPPRASLFSEQLGGSDDLDTLRDLITAAE